jgi:hypothetical protein
LLQNQKDNGRMKLRRAFSEVAPVTVDLVQFFAEQNENASSLVFMAYFVSDEIRGLIYGWQG